ncbi:MAG: CHASE2 domain-containing sensor protein [Cyclobacteriaceae bacterium]|jgi:CHASE2 domain-containing sensor protein
MRKFLRDTLCCCVFIFGLIGLFGSLTVFRIFDVLDPVGDMFADFELSDLVMSTLREEPPADESIVVINIGDANREKLATMIDILGQYEPAVIGVDVTFNEPKPYQEDSLLETVLKKYDNVVIGSELRLFNNETERFDTLLVPEARLALHADWGFVNLLTNADNQDDLKACREFVVRQQVKGSEDEELAFAVKLAQYKSPEKTKRFLARDNTIETINYRGNAYNNGQSKFGTRYSVLDIPDVFNENFTPDLIKDNVLILCYMGRYLGDNQTRTDNYFTPLNKHYVGKAEPDMFGGVVHANITSMILQEDYVNTMSNGSVITCAVLVCLFNVFLFKIIYAAVPRWYDGISKTFQLLQLLLAMGLMIWLFDLFSFKADLTLTLIVIALTGDSIEFYHGVIRNLFSRRARAELLMINRNVFKEA